MHTSLNNVDHYDTLNKVVEDFLLEHSPTFKELLALRNKVSISINHMYVGIVLTCHRVGKTLTAMLSSRTNVKRQTKQI